MPQLVPPYFRLKRVIQITKRALLHCSCMNIRKLNSENVIFSFFCSQKQQSLQEASSQPVNASVGIQSGILREKLKELDVEIEKFRSENSNLEKLRREREEVSTRVCEGRLPGWVENSDFERCFV